MLHHGFGRGSSLSVLSEEDEQLFCCLLKGLR